MPEPTQESNRLHRRHRGSHRGGLACLALVLSAAVASLSGAAPAETDADGLGTPRESPRFGRAALEVVGTNLTIWSYDRFIREGGGNPEFRVGLDSIWDNFLNQFEWDNNTFGTNNFAHPYHGGLYFTAARSNGYSYWESIPFAFAGSYLWEFSGERNNPAYNDWINTSVGGTVIGESLYRLSDLVLDDTARGGERFWRELGGLLISPMRGINRLISGEWSRVGPNPPHRRPGSLGFRLETGARNQSRQRVANEDTTGAFVRIDFIHGDPFTGESLRPFDYFTVGLQINFNDVSTLGRMQVLGLLTGRATGGSGETRHVLGAYQAFEFIDNRGFEFGGQSLGALWLSRLGDVEAGLGLRTELGLGMILLAGTSSEVESFSGREYDYGSGAAARLNAGLRYGGRTLVELGGETAWLHTLNGAPGSYLISIAHLQAVVPLKEGLGLGAEIRGYHRKAWYDDFPDVSRWLPEGRLFATLALY